MIWAKFPANINVKIADPTFKKVILFFEIKMSKKNNFSIGPFVISHLNPLSVTREAIKIELNSERDLFLMDYAGDQYIITNEIGLLIIGKFDIEKALQKIRNTFVENAIIYENFLKEDEIYSGPKLEVTISVDLQNPVDLNIELDRNMFHS
ncbi:hypothetical protein [Leptospira broomii]|nr:hypothetical protein [Leptospira broomii]